MTTPKKLHRFQALVYLAGAIVAPVILIPSSGGSKGGFGAAAIVGGFLLAVSCYHWIKFKHTPAEAVFYDIAKEPPAEQIRVSKRTIWMMAILGPGLSYWTYYDLMSVETGTVGSVSVWAPVAMLYNNFGFWPAVLCWPLLCLFVIAVAFFRIEKAKAIMTTQEG